MRSLVELSTTNKLDASSVIHSRDSGKTNTVASKLTMRVLAVISDRAAVLGIFFDSINKPANRLLVIFVLLTPDDDL